MAKTFLKIRNGIDLGQLSAAPSDPVNGSFYYDTILNTMRQYRNGSWVNVGSGDGTVTSVAASVPGFLSIAGSPVTTSGTLAITYSGTALPMANGGTGLTSTPAAGELLIGNAGGTAYALHAVTGDVTLSSTGVTAIAANVVTDAKFRQSAALSVVGNASNATNNVADISGAANTVLRVNSAGTVLGFGSINLASSSAVTGTLTVTNGGTGQSSLTSHYVLVGNGSSAVTMVNPGATTGVPLISNGAASDPSFGQLALGNSSAVTGTLQVANGGTGQASLTTYALLAGGTTSTGALQQVSGLGSSGQVLTSNGAGLLPTWQPATGGSGTVAVTSKTTTYTATTSDYLIQCDASGGAFTVTLPAASNTGKIFIIKKTDSSTNAVTISRAGSDTIDGATSTTVNTQYEEITIIGDGSTNWSTVDRNYPQTWTSFTASITSTGSSPTFGTVAQNVARWRRVGDSMEVIWNYQQSTAGTNGTGTYLFNLPTGYTIDTNKMFVPSSSTSARASIVGNFNAFDGSFNVLGCTLVYSTAAVFAEVLYNSGATTGSGLFGNGVFGFGNTALDIGFKFCVPISGWKS